MSCEIRLSAVTTVSETFICRYLQKFEEGGKQCLRRLVCHRTTLSKDPLQEGKDQIRNLILTVGISKHNLNQVLMSV